MSQIKPDCVVSDILMPDMDGESLLRALRAVPGLEAVPFIALSAVRSEARIRAVVGAGADAFLLKPFPLRELTEKVRSLVERPQAARQVRGPARRGHAADAPGREGAAHDEHDLAAPPRAADAAAACRRARPRRRPRPGLSALARPREPDRR